ncbi:hypothetical protein EDC01DRAFT_212394 [Geopyxis carbonaria]|nr:hypothetical protein EDC01DRAFT_212394 [Geopyxis carbonaria]
MSLTLPTARVPLIRPLTDALEPYDSPGTPGTTYSFQDQVSTKHSMQAEPHHHLLAPPIHDTGLLISTDDEMVDSDNDQHRDEDYDIEIDAIEVYVEQDNDVGMVIDEDANAYGDQDAEDDLMLDDDIIDVDVDVVQHEEQAVPEYHISEAEVGAAIAQSEVEPVADPYVEPPQQNNLDVSHTPIQEPEVHLFNEDQEVPKSPPTTSKLEEVNSNEQTEHAEPDEVKPNDIANSDHSSATLSDGQPGTVEASFVEEEVTQTVEETSYSLEEAIAESINSPENDVYQYPIIITYEDSRVSLFPPPAAWTEDSSLDIPSEFFLQDTDVCDKGFDDLFVQLRSVLGESVGPEKELFLRIELLGLEIGEDNMACKTVCLRHVLDWHNQLQKRDDSTVDPPPVCMELYTSFPRCSARLEQLAAAATDGKALNDYFQLIGFEDVDSVHGEVDEEVEAHVVDKQTDEQPQTEASPRERYDSPSPFDEEEVKQPTEVVETLEEPLEVPEQRFSEPAHENATFNTNDEAIATDYFRD